MRALNFSMIKLTGYLILGILIGNWFQFQLDQVLVVTISLVPLVLLVMFVLRKNYKKQYWVGFLMSCSLVLIGVFSTFVHEESNHKNHYLNLSSSLSTSPNVFTIKIIEVLKPGRYHDKYIVEIQSFNQHKSKGKLLLNLNRDSHCMSLDVDDLLFSKSVLTPINKPFNPHQFDYSNYMAKKYIYHRVTLSGDQLLSIRTQKNSLGGLAASFRSLIIQKLNNTIFETETLSIINALLLGQRQDISETLYENYAKAGAIHILAVSGLHVGIILIILQNLLKPLDYWLKGKIIKIAIIVFLMWTYALIAGLSASVVRAVTMFTLFAIALNLKRPTNSYNTIAISIFFLLLFKPNFLFDVGFQLSYSAVLSIITIEPLIRKLWRPKFKIIYYLWRIMTVSLAAQIGVFPLSLYYFHQFPGLFFLSNLVILPGLGFLLGLGLLIIVLALIGQLPNWLSSFYNDLIGSLNYFVEWVASQESFVFQNISFDAANVMFSYMVIILTVYIIKKRSFAACISFLILIVGFQGYSIYNKTRSNHNSLIIFHKSRNTLIGFQNGRNLTLHHDLDPKQIDEVSFLENFSVAEKIQVSSTDSIKDVYTIDKNHLLVIDSLGVYNVKTFQPSIILLRGSPKINLIRLIDSLKPNFIVCDGSNFRSYQERWEATCKAKKIPFHQTSKKGAFIYRYTSTYR